MEKFLGVKSHRDNKQMMWRWCEDELQMTQKWEVSQEFMGMIYIILWCPTSSLDHPTLSYIIPGHPMSSYIISGLFHAILCCPQVICSCLHIIVTVIHYSPVHRSGRDDILQVETVIQLVVLFSATLCLFTIIICLWLPSSLSVLQDIYASLNTKVGIPCEVVCCHFGLSNKNQCFT